MLTCIACSKQLNGGSLPQQPDVDDAVATPSKKQAIKTLTTQIKGMALTAYKNCKPCSGGNDNRGGSEELQTASSGRFNRGYRRANPGTGNGVVKWRNDAGFSEWENRLSGVHGGG